MSKIIMIGSGKAGLIHFKAYKKLGLEEDVVFVDVSKTSKYFPDKTIYATAKEAIEALNLNPAEVIADVATPKEVFYQVIEECRELGIKNMIVEKPFILKNDDDFSDVNLVMVENYLFSKIFKYIKDYIKDNDLTVKTVYSNFSKNRRQNSSERRGMVTQTVNCFNIEMPHQVYLAQELVSGEPNLLYKEAKDMVFEDFRLKDHGEGLLIVQNGDALCYLYSNLMTDSLEKYINVVTDKGYSLQGDFFTYTPDLQIITKGGVKVYKDGKLIGEQYFDEDDMITYMLDEFISYFKSGKHNPEYRQSMIKFSNFYKKYDI